MIHFGSCKFSFKHQFNDLWWNWFFFASTRDIINGLPWNRTICYNQKLVHSTSLKVFWTKLKKIFRRLFHLFKTKFNKAKLIARYFKQHQPSYKIYYGNKWYPLLDIMISKEGKKVLMCICSKPTDSKRYVSFKSNCPKHCLKNISFSLFV